MIYDATIKYIENLIDEVLIQLGETPLLNNENFEIVKSKIHDKSYVVIELVKPNAINLILWLEVDTLRIDIDRIEEYPVYSWDFLNKNRKIVKNILNMILTSFIKVKHYGKHYTELEFLDSNNKVLDKFMYKDTIFFIKKNLEEKIYQPIFNSTISC